MERQEIINKMNSIFCDVFDDDTIKISNNMTSADIEEWDSLNQITLVVNIEKIFDMKLNLVEISKLENIGEMIELILSKIKP